MHDRSSRTQPHGIYRTQPDINVTPLVDVMLVLLIIFMVTAPMLTAGLQIELPQATAARALKSEKPIVLTVTKDGAVVLGQEELQLERVVEAVMSQNGGDLSRTIYLQADKAVSHGAVVAVLDVLAAHALTHIAVITHPAAAPPSIDRAPGPLPARDPSP
jgi:biopolymer transport protein TolR